MAKAKSGKTISAKASDVGATRTEIETVLLRLIEEFFRSPGPFDRKAAVRRLLKVSDPAWMAFGAEINRDADIRSRGMSISGAQMANAQSVADIAAHLVASRDSLIIYFSGHGAASPSSKRGDAEATPPKIGARGPLRAPKSPKVKRATAKKVKKGAPLAVPKMLRTDFKTLLADDVLELKLPDLSDELPAPPDPVEPPVPPEASRPFDIGAEIPFSAAERIKSPVANEPGVPPTFFFELQGDAARGDQALWGQEFDLVFDYGILSDHALAEVKGQHIDDLLKADTTASLGIDIVPVGLTLVSGGAGRIVRFENGKRIGDQPRFRLRALKEDDVEEQPPYGVHVIFTVAGAMIYTAFLKIDLVNTFVDAPRATTVIDLDLAHVASVKVDQSRIASVYFNTEGGCWRISGKVGAIDLPNECTKLVGPPNLEAAYRDVLQAFTAIAGNVIWGNLDGSLKGAADDAKAAEAAMKATAEAGWMLYTLLSQDEAIRNVLARIERLPEGSRISFYSDGVVFPWELLYPLEYVGDFPPDNFKPEKFWGRRFIIESLLLTKTEDETPPSKRRQPKPLRVSMGYNSGIDAEPPWNTAGRPLLPVRLQTDYFDKTLTTRGGYFDQQNAILDTVRTAYPSSLIYYFCHGSASQLKFERTSPPIKPANVMGADYPGWPLIFLNACDAADISPLSLFSFRKQFRAKKAAGLIAPSFPVPTLFAAVFARAFMSAYADGKDTVGDILFRLRRELLAKNNPLGLWYSLQCPLDLKAPLDAPAPGV